MRPLRQLSLMLALLIAFTGLSALPAAAQGGGLVGYAVTPAETVTDGDAAGTALAGGVINGLAVPFASQPFGAVVGLLVGSYDGTYEALVSGTFDSAGQSSDFVVRIYVLEIDWNGGLATPIGWLTLTDQDQLLGSIAKGGERTRPLTGADITPRAFARLADGTYWIADANSNSLLRFDGKGRLTAAPIALANGGQVVGLSVRSDGLLVAAQQSGGSVSFNLVNPNDGSDAGAWFSYALDGGNSFGGFSVASGDAVVVIENDGRDNGGSKGIYRADASGKSLLLDLNNINDPQGLSGQGNPFTFPYAEINGIAVDSDGIVIVNNNRVPFSNVRQSGVADPTEFLKIG